MCELFDKYYEMVVAKHRNIICLCCVLTATYKIGRNKLPEAEYTSDLHSDDGTELSQKRKKRP